MLKRKNVKKCGKLELSKYFQEFKVGEKVAVVKEHTLSPAFPLRLQGRTGLVAGKRGNAYIIKIFVGGIEKTHIINPSNLKKLK